MTEWKEYILEEGNNVTFPKYKDEPCFTLDMLEQNDATIYQVVCSSPDEITEEKLEQNKKILEEAIKEKTGNLAEFGLVIKLAKTNPHSKGKLCAGLIIFQHKDYSWCSSPKVFDKDEFNRLISTSKNFFLTGKE